MRSKVDFPQPEGPTMQDELARLDIEIDVVQRENAPGGTSRRPYKAPDLIAVPRR